MELDILGWGANTAVGLSAAQTCAAVRAGASRLEPVLWPLPIEEPYWGAKVPAAPGLRTSLDEWLLNLAARSVLEACARTRLSESTTALFVLVPDRQPAVKLDLAAFERRLGWRLHSCSRVVRGDAANVVDLLELARDSIATGGVSACLVGAADSRLEREQLERLRRADRLHRGEVQGLIPGEGAAFLLLGPASAASPRLARIAGFGRGYEPNTVDGPNYSVGDGTREAFEAALADSGCSEAAIDLVCSTMNGERYAAIEAGYVLGRCYRTRRKRLLRMWPAATTGDIGAAAGLLALIVAGMAMLRGQVPGSLAACEVGSDASLRAVIMVRRVVRELGWYERLSR